MLTRTIPSTGEALPVIGLGTWETFDVSGKKALQPLAQVLNVMRDAGGSVIDTSPMYGKAETVIGELTQEPEWRNDLFYATKVWTTGRREGIQQMESSFQKMKRSVMDLMQIHNLVDWKTHLATLKAWKAEGKIRYIGFTHYTDSMHAELERIITTETIDFVQFNYSIASRHAEERLLPACAERGTAVLVNRPFGKGGLLNAVKGKPLPPWAAELGVHSWPSYFLKYIISHPAVTCVIPATADPDHARENFASASEPLPNPSDRQKMATHIDAL